MSLDLNFDVAVERPNEGETIMHVNEACRRFGLEDWEIEELAKGRVIWLGSTAINKVDYDSD